MVFIFRAGGSFCSVIWFRVDWKGERRHGKYWASVRIHIQNFVSW